MGAGAQRAALKNFSSPPSRSERRATALAGAVCPPMIRRANARVIRGFIIRVFLHAHSHWFFLHRGDGDSRFCLVFYIILDSLFFIGSTHFLFLRKVCRLFFQGEKKCLCSYLFFTAYCAFVLWVEKILLMEFSLRFKKNHQIL